MYGVPSPTTWMATAILLCGNKWIATSTSAKAVKQSLMEPATSSTWRVMSGHSSCPATCHGVSTRNSSSTCKPNEKILLGQPGKSLWESRTIACSSAPTSFTSGKVTRTSSVVSASYTRVWVKASTASCSDTTKQSRKCSQYAVAKAST